MGIYEKKNQEIELDLEKSKNRKNEIMNALKNFFIKKIKEAMDNINKDKLKIDNLKLQKENLLNNNDIINVNNDTSNINNIKKISLDEKMNTNLPTENRVSLLD